MIDVTVLRTLPLALFRALRTFVVKFGEHVTVKLRVPFLSAVYVVLVTSQDLGPVSTAVLFVPVAVAAATGVRFRNLTCRWYVPVVATISGFTGFYLAVTEQSRLWPILLVIVLVVAIALGVRPTTPKDS